MSLSGDTARRNVSLIKDATSLLNDRNPPPSLRETNASLKDITKERHDTSRKLLTLGAALLIVPDPITDMAAVPVLIAGKVMQSRASIGVKNVHAELRETLSQLSSACSL